MITTLIVSASLTLAAGFLVAWLLRPDFRRQIESPKHDFQSRVRRYDRQCLAETDSGEGGTDES
jgi:hypothetical protein